jgi:subfamily B ATP-binding cassette protein HlyB/CyaB
MIQDNDQRLNDQGLFALAMLLRLHGIAAEQAQLRHRLGTVAVGITEMLRCAKE